MVPKMFGKAKEHAAEIDTKLRVIRKKVAAFACGYDEEFKSTSSKVESAKKFLKKTGEDLAVIHDEASDIVQQTEQLDQLLNEANENADKVFALLSQYYAALQLEMPSIDVDALPVGFKFEKSTTIEEIQEEAPDSSNDSSLRELLSSDDSTGVTEEEFGSKIFISRPNVDGCDGAVTCTPMIKARKKLLPDP